MKKPTTFLLFVMCLTTAFLLGINTVNAQVLQAKSPVVKNALAEIVRAKGGDKRFPLITPDILAKLQSGENNLSNAAVGDPCSTAISIAIGQNVGGAINQTDCRLDDGTYAKFYMFSGNQGQQITIKMNSSSIDSYLGLANESGTFVVEDDDSGGGLSALIKATLPETGQYIILANTALPNQFGGYDLSLSGAAQCTFSVTSNATEIPATGGTFTFNVVTQPECYWQTYSYDSYTTANASGIGSGTGIGTVQQNGSGAARQVHVTAGSAPLLGIQSVLSIPQQSVACTYSLNPPSVNIAPQAMTGTFQIIAPAGCPWSVQSGEFSTASGSGSGIGTITYSMPNNNDAARVEIIRVGGLEFRINQAGLNCEFKFTPSQINIGRQGGTRTINVAVQPGCMWATTRNATWIELFNTSGTGAGTISFKVGAQTEAGERTGAVQIFYGRNSNSVLINQSRNNFNSTLDYDGDGKADVSVYRPSSATWYLNRSTQGFSAAQFGASGDKIVPADYDGDGKTDIAVFRPSNGNWYWLNSSTGTFSAAQFGTTEDIPAPADFDGDGRADLAVYRPSSGTWYQMRSVFGFNAVQFGTAEDQPVAADFDNDGKGDVAVFRPSNGVWYQLKSSAGFAAVQFGASEDKPVPADFDGDGKIDIAVYRPSSGTWYFLNSQTGFAAVQFGTSEDKPSPADFDGDGKTDIAVFRPSNGVWYQQRSTQGFAAVQFGITEDKPAANAFVR